MISRLTCGIVFYDEISDLKRLIPQIKEELKSFIDSKNLQWIFVLNHEQPQIRTWIQNWILQNVENALCIENPSNNLGYARQLILENSEHDYIYMTDPDIELKPFSLIKLIQLAETESLNDKSLNILGYGGAVIHTSTTPLLQSTFNLISTLAKRLPFSFQVQNHSHLATVDHLPSCHLLLKKKESLDIGGFNVLFAKVGEDLDFSHRAFNLNFRFVFLPSSQVLHHQNYSLEKWLYKMFVFGKIQISVQRLHFKNGLRYYRLLPLLGFLLLFTCALATGLNFLAIAAATLTLSLFNLGLFGFFMTALSYSIGEFAELVYPSLEQKNESQLQDEKANLYLQVSKTNNSFYSN